MLIVVPSAVLVEVIALQSLLMFSVLVSNLVLQTAMARSDNPSISPSINNNPTIATTATTSSDSISTQVNALYNEGLALSSLGNFALAIQYYEKALVLDPNNVKVLINIAGALAMLGHYTQGKFKHIES